ncbi:MAG: hypothetical protein IPN60_04690 [Saprospiraceae bacterium]|nr:hypothetical protein [Candidatus Opimibacter skivensis]
MHRSKTYFYEILLTDGCRKLDACATSPPLIVPSGVKKSIPMKVHLLEKAIDHYISASLKPDALDWYYPHAMVSDFNTHWSPPDPAGLSAIYDSCLRSDYSQRWWKRDHYRPKEIMLLLIEADTELATIAWKDLSNDTAPLEGRLSRFDYYCNELLQIHRQKHFRSVETYHHQDAPVLSLYLSGLFPHKYALYPGLDIFQSFCRAIGSPDIPVVDDLIRYMKVASIVFTFLQRNPRYELLLKQRDPSMHKVSHIPFLQSFEVIAFEGERYKTSGT